MAGNAVVGALRVTLGLDSAQFTSGMREAQTGLQRFAGIAKAGALAIGSALVAAGGAMALAMRGVINDADEMSKMAQKLGVPIEELSRLRYAAELSDISLEDLGKSLRRLSAGMLDASQNATGTAAESFAMLGVSVRDAEGNMRSSTSVIEDLAARFARMPDGVEKTAMAMRIFGKSGADMIPLLNSGAEGLREMYEEAEQLGIVLDRETGLAAERFNDNLTRLGRTKDGIITKISAGMLPALSNLTDALANTSRNTGLLNAVGGALGRVLQVQYSVIAGVAGAFSFLARSINTTTVAAGRLVRGDFAGAAEALRTGAVDISASIRSTVSTIRNIWKPLENVAAVDTATDAVEDLGGATRNAARATAGLSDEQKALRDLMEEGRRTFEQTRTPAEIYAARVEELGRQLRATAIDQDTFNRAMIDARKAFESSDPSTQMWSNTAKEIRDAAAAAREDAARRVADGLENFRELQEDAYDATYDGVRGGLEAAADGNLGQYLASRIREALFDNLATTLTDLIRGPKGGGAGGGLSGWVSAAGSVLKSFAGGIPGFATGGSFKVGGQAGVDKNLVSFRATKGEMVDIRRPGQDAGGSMVVHVNPSPYFDVQVERVAAPMAVQAAATAYGATRSDMATAQRRSRQRFV